MAGTVTLRGSETYTLPVTVSDLSEELNVTLPQEITGGSYECAVSLLTEQTVEPPNDPDIPDIPEDPDDPDNPDTPDEPDTPSGGGGGGSAADGKPDVEVSGTGGTAAAANNGTVTITPDEGYKISTITVNGKEIAVPSDGKLTGLNRNDRVVSPSRKPIQKDCLLSARLLTLRLTPGMRMRCSGRWSRNHRRNLRYDIQP